MGADVHLERMIADLVKKSLWLLPTNIIEDQGTLQKFIDNMAAVRDRWNQMTEGMGNRVRYTGMFLQAVSVMFRSCLKLESKRPSVTQV